MRVVFAVTNVSGSIAILSAVRESGRPVEFATLTMDESGRVVFQLANGAKSSIVDSHSMMIHLPAER